MAYTLNAGLQNHTVSGGESWITFDVETVALPKTATLLITDGNATVQAADGTVRLAGPERFVVLTLNVTSAAAPFVAGVNTVVVPRALFLDSGLWADFNGSTPDYGPLADASYYGEDLSAANVSEDVAGLIAGNLTGSQATAVLDRLLRNATNVEVFDYVDITAYVVLANLPTDVVRVLPWSPVANGPTGAVPETFWEKIGAAATTAVNVLLVGGQLVLDGLVALGTFLVDLAQAAWAWGMALAGTVGEAAQAALDRVGAVLQELIAYVVNTLSSMIQTLFQTLASAVAGYVEAVHEAQVRFLAEVARWDGGGPGRLTATLAAAAGMVAAMLGLAGYVQPILDALLTFAQSVEPVLRVLDPIFLLDTVVSTLVPEAPSVGDLVDRLVAQGLTLLLDAVVGPSNSLAALLGLSVVTVPADATPKPSMAAALGVHEAAGPNEFSADVVTGLEETRGGLEEGHATSLLEYGLISIALGVISLRFSHSAHFLSRPSIPNARLGMAFGGLWELIGLVLPIVALFSPPEVAPSLVAFNFFAFTLLGGVVGIIGAAASGIVWVAIVEGLLLLLGGYIVWQLTHG